MTLTQFVLILLLANTLLVGFHLDIGLGFFYINIHFRGLFHYVFPDHINEEDIPPSQRG